MELGDLRPASLQLPALPQQYVLGLYPAPYDGGAHRDSALPLGVPGFVAGALAYLLCYQLLGAELILPLSLQGASAAILSVCAAGITVDRKILSMFTLRFSGRSIPPIALWILLFFIFLSAGQRNLGGHLPHLGGLLFGVGCGLYYRHRLRSLRSTTNTDLESLLEKIRHSGIHSLSPIERRLLMEHSSSTEDKN